MEYNLINTVKRPRTVHYKYLEQLHLITYIVELRRVTVLYFVALYYVACLPELLHVEVPAPLQIG